MTSHLAEIHTINIHYFSPLRKTRKNGDEKYEEIIENEKQEERDNYNRYKLMQSKI